MYIRHGQYQEYSAYNITMYAKSDGIKGKRWATRSDEQWVVRDGQWAIGVRGQDEMSEQ